LAYGDESLLREGYEGMKRYVDFLDGEAAKSGGLQTWGLKDWICVEDTPVAMINTPAHVHYARIVSRAAAMLNKPDDAQKYAQMAERIRNGFNLKFLDQESGIYGEKGRKVVAGDCPCPGGFEALHETWWTGDRVCTEAGQVLPLVLGLVPEQSRSAVEAALLREIAAHKGRLSTGFVSTPYLLDVLNDLDPEACWRLVTTREFPSWYSMTLGSKNTLMKENWTGGQALMPSLGGSVARWCYRGLGGIRPDESGPGFRKIIIKPAIVSGLDWVECYHDTPYGRVVSNWRRNGRQLAMEVVIPPNTTATVYVPVALNDVAKVTESGVAAAQAKSVKFLQMEKGAAVYQIESGSYKFIVIPSSDRTL